MSRQESAADLLEEIREFGTGLTKWENEFVVIMQTWVDGEKRLQPQQIRKLEKIKEHRVPK